MNDFDEYCKRADRRRRNELNRQRVRLQWYIAEIVVVMKERNGTFDRQNADYVDEKIIPYLNKMKWLPDSYLDMLEQFKKGESRPTRKEV